MLLLIYEESLDFGLGAEENLRTLGLQLPTTTIICITKTNSMIFEFTDIILMDAGIVVDRVREHPPGCRGGNNHPGRLGARP